MYIVYLYNRNIIYWHVTVHLLLLSTELCPTKRYIKISTPGSCECDHSWK